MKNTSQLGETQMFNKNERIAPDESFVWWAGLTHTFTFVFQKWRIAAQRKMETAKYFCICACVRRVCLVRNYSRR